MTARRPASGAPARQRGAAAIEFQIISIMVLIPLLLGVLQLGLFMIAKNTLNVATLAAARAGAASGGSKAAMNHALVLGLTPLHVSTGKQKAGVGMGDITPGNYALVIAGAYAESKVATGLAGRITVLNPTPAAFEDFGIDRNGQKVIPVTSVFDNNTVGRNSRQTRADALLLKIEVRYCYAIEIKFIAGIINKVMNDPNLLTNDTSPEDRLCYAANRVPITSQAVVRMTVPPVQRAMF